MSVSKKSSFLTFLFVLGAAGGSFLWWAQNRPSYVLMQLKKEEKRGNIGAVVSHYERLLNQKNITTEEELKLRESLGAYYWDLGQIESTIFLASWDDASFKADRPFLAKAKAQFKRMLELDPQSSNALLFLGIMQLIEGKETFAIEELNRSRKNDPTSPHPLYYLAQIQLDRGHHEKARKLALEALALDSKYDKARMVLVDIYGQTGEMEKAMKEFDRLSPEYKSVSKNQAQFALYLAQNNNRAASLSHIQKAIINNEKSDFVHLQYGRILLEFDQLEEATGELGLASSINPRSPWPLVWQANVFQRQGRCAEVKKISRLLVDALPRWHWTHWVRGLSNVCEGDSVSALASLDEAQRLSPQFLESAKLKAQILIDKGQYEDLGKALRPLLDEKVSEDFAFTTLGQSLYRQGQWELSIEMSQSAIEKNPNSAWAYVWRGLAQAELKDFGSAERSMNQAISLRETDPLILANYAYFNLIKKDFARAQSTIEKVIKIYPEEPLLWFTQGEIYHAQKLDVEAIQAYKRSIDIRPYDLRSHLKLADSYRRLGKNDLAQDVLRLAQKINPRFQ